MNGVPWTAEQLRAAEAWRRGDPPVPGRSLGATHAMRSRQRGLGAEGVTRYVRRRWTAEEDHIVMTERTLEAAAQLHRWPSTIESRRRLLLRRDKPSAPSRAGAERSVVAGEAKE